MKLWQIGLAAIVLALPLWCVHQPAMPDYPAHLASYHLIAGGASKFYHIEWAFLPNLAGEILIPPFSKLAGLDFATRLFITVGLMLWVFGPALIQRALFGRMSIAPLFAAFFAYNANFVWGFLNYDFAMGASLVVFAAWIASEGRRTPLHLMGFALAATAIYFSHLFALATLGLLMMSFELGVWWEARSARAMLRRAASLAAVFIPAAICFLFLKPPGQSGDGVVFNLLTTAFDRLDAAILLSFDNPSYVLLALLAVLFGVGLWRGWIAVHRRMYAPLVALALAAIFMPEWAMGGWGVHMRLPAVLGALAFASVEFRLGRDARRALAASAAIVLAYNALALTRSWVAYDRQFDEFRAAARTLPPGARLMTVLDGDAIGYRSDQPYWHMAEFAIVDRGAFTPLLFTTKDQHIVRIDPQWQDIAAGSAEQGSPPDIDELDDLAAGRIDHDEDIANVFPYLMRFPCHYDQAVVIHLDGPRAQVPKMLKLRHAGSFFSIYDIVPDASCAKS
jgi:hypothetical protein